MVRHTETVHVTTRHTIVGESGGRYGGYPAAWSGSSPGERRRGHGIDEDDHSWSDGDDHSRRDDSRRWSGAERSDERSWSGTGQEEARAWSGRDEERSWSGRSHEEDRPWSPAPEESRWSTGDDDWSAARDGGSGYPGGPAGDRDWGSRDDRGWDAGGQQWETPADPTPAARGHRADDTGAYWAQLRAGDRWAAVRDDDRGREVRVGERRAELHADPVGTEYRVEDRWASVRRDEPRRAAGDDGWRDGEGRPAPVGCRCRTSGVRPASAATSRNQRGATSRSRRTGTSPSIRAANVPAGSRTAAGTAWRSPDTVRRGATPALVAGADPATVRPSRAAPDRAVTCRCRPPRRTSSRGWRSGPAPDSRAAGWPGPARSRTRRCAT